MAVGSNKDLLGKGSKFREPTNGQAGRPKVNRDLVIQNLKAKDALGNNRYSRAQVAKLCNCSAKTVGRIYREAVESGEIIPDEETKAIGIVEADFDAECMRSQGLSFMEWLNTRFSDPSTAVYHFNFCSRVWENLWGRPDLVEIANTDSQLGDQVAMQFLTEFQEDTKRMRSRLKLIRFLFRFLKRGDINDKYLTMSNHRHPRAKRRIPEISMTTFPLEYQRCEERVREILGEEAVLDLRLKIVTQMRTGSKKQEREFYGLQKGTESKSYLVMASPDEYQFHVFAKKSEEWDVIWMPRLVKDALYERYLALERGDLVAQTSKQKLIDTWGDVTEEIMGVRLILHDLRKISLTWLYVMGVPLEVATQLNVGWKDLSTAHGHYIEIKKVLRKSFRQEYAENIPDWFKEGLDDFTGFEAVIPDGSSALGAIQGTAHFG